MDEFMGFLKGLGENWVGIIVLLISIYAIVNLLNKVINLFRKHPASSSTGPDGTAQARNAWGLFVKVITEFRHLLALVIVSIFAFALGYALFTSDPGGDDLSKNLQAVTSTLGGLVGSIIGYYFGESKAETAAADRRPDPGPARAGGDARPTPPIDPAPPPPGG